MPDSTERNGQPATTADLTHLAFAGYAHFTAMQVRHGKVRGLDLHLQRLRQASMAMFGKALDDQQITDHLRSAVKASDAADLSITATIYSSAGEFTAADSPQTLQILVRTAAPAQGPTGPLRLDIVNYERVVPEIKHVGEIAKTWFLRKAVERGYDDAAFIDAQGRISEGSIWNLAFWDGHAVVWPRAAMLRGTTMSILMRQLENMGIPQAHADITLDTLQSLQGAVVMNSWTPAIAVHGLGAADIPPAPEFTALLHQAYANEAPTPLMPPRF